MREIKFRAWDRKNNRIMRSVGFTDSDVGRFWVRERAMIDDGSNGRSQDWIPMQYTGLKDKNDVKIYEGDVVVVYDNPANTGAVIWWGLGWHVQTSPDDIITLNAMSEVIGNIYENPELLTPSHTISIKERES